MAHINEHLGFEYRRQIEQTLGMPLPPEKNAEGDDNHLNPEVEARLAPMLAMAAQQLLQKNQQEVAQQQAQQQMQDPLVQIQMQELQIKAQEQQRKQQKDQTDAALKAAQLQIERERITTQQQTDDKRIRVDAIKAATDQGRNREEMMAKLSVDVLKHLSNKSHEEQARQQTAKKGD